MKLHIEYRTHDNPNGTRTREIAYGMTTLPTPPNSLGKALTAAAITIAVALAWWGLVLTDLPPGAY